MSVDKLPVFEDFPAGKDQTRLVSWIKSKIFRPISRRVNFLLSLVNSGFVEIPADDVIPGANGNWRWRHDDTDLVLQRKVAGTWTDTGIKMFSTGNVRIGDVDGSTYLDVENDGDTFWVGAGSGLPYSHMYVDGTQPIRVAMTKDTPTEVKDDGTSSVDDGWLAGDLNLITFPTGGTEHHLTISKAGVYQISWNLSFKMVTGAANTQIHAGLAIDSTTFRRDKCEGHRTISNNTDTGNMSGSCMVDLPNGNEELSLWMENTTNNNDADISHGSLTIVMVGGT